MEKIDNLKNLRLGRLDEDQTIIQIMDFLKHLDTYAKSNSIMSVNQAAYYSRMESKLGAQLKAICIDEGGRYDIKKLWGMLEPMRRRYGSDEASDFGLRLLNIADRMSKLSVLDTQELKPVNIDGEAKEESDNHMQDVYEESMGMD